VVAVSLPPRHGGGVNPQGSRTLDARLQSSFLASLRNPP
jgi:hypothetical protein